MFRILLTFDDLTDEVLLKRLKNQVELKSELLKIEDLEHMLQKRVKIGSKEPDLELGITYNFIVYHTFFTCKGLNDLVESKTNLAVQHLTSLLQPTTL